MTKEDVLAAADGKGATATPAAAADGAAKPLRGPAAMLAKAMNESRSIPTATSFRNLAVDTLDAKRKAINAALKERGMKVSFTHLIAWAIVKAASEWPVMGRSYTEIDGKPHAVEPVHVNLGIAVDVERKDGYAGPPRPLHQGGREPRLRRVSRLLRGADHQDAREQAHRRRLPGHDDHADQPGRAGTVASVPRLMSGQGTIVACGSLAYPVEWAHATADRIKALGDSKVMTPRRPTTTG